MPSADTPDTTVALAGGLYLGLVCGPLCVLAAPLPPDLGTQYVALLAAVTALLVAGTWLLGRRPGWPARLGAGPRRFLPAVVAPVAAAGGYAVLAATGRPSTTALALLALAGGGGLAVGGVLAVQADTRHVRAVLADAAVHARWEAPWPDERRRQARVVGVAAGAAAALAFLADVAVVRYAGQFLLPLTVLVTSLGRETTYRATTAGLAVRTETRERLRPWDRFEGYALTEAAVVLYPRAPWRLPVYCDRQAVDAEAVTAALDRHLPRLLAP